MILAQFCADLEDGPVWHSPIPEIARQGREMLGTYVERRCSYLHPLASRTIPLTDTHSPIYSEVVCLLGDAAHPMPHNLAQGATLALEEAYWLAYAIHQANETGAMNGAKHHVCRNFDELRTQRVQNCSLVSTFTHYLAHPPIMRQSLSSLRDHLLHAVPHPLNGFVFDTFLKYSLGGSNYSTIAELR